MPKLYIFATCEKVITDKEDRVSLIALLNQLDVQILPNSPEISSNAVAPKEWCAFSSWEIEPEDIGKEYRQITQLLYPGGELFGPPMVGNFSPEIGKAYSQVYLVAVGFPIGKEGSYTLKMWLECGGSTVFESKPIIIRVNHRRLDSVPSNVSVLR